MKRTILLFSLLLPGSIALAQTDLPHVDVYGTAQRNVPPDELNWSVSVKTLGSVVSAISQKQTELTATVLAYLRDAGIDADDLKTARMQLNENWLFRNGSRIQEGYYAYTSITFKTDDLSSYEQMWDQLSRFENLTIDNVSFGISNRIQIRDEMRIEALQAARRKAESMARALGATVLEPLTIEEIPETSRINSAPGGSNVVFTSASSDVSEETAVAAGLESVIARVRVAFRIATN